MLFLVELDHVKTGTPPTPETGRAFIERIIFPTLALAEQLAAEKKIVAGGPVAGRIALRLMIEEESPERVDRIVTSLPIWAQAETRVMPLLTFAQRRSNVQALWESLGTSR